MNITPENPNSRCGYVAIIGKPNVGKSTLLNHLLGRKLSITSRKPQTTRHRILGVKTLGDTQILYVDTPGLHKKMPRQINRYMNRVARAALHDVDVVLFVVDATSWNDEDVAIAKMLQNIEKPIVVAINKIDRTLAPLN
jgi:GTP-binding protein Era